VQIFVYHESPAEHVADLGALAAGLGEVFFVGGLTPVELAVDAVLLHAFDDLVELGVDGLVEVLFGLLPDEALGDLFDDLAHRSRLLVWRLARSLAAVSGFSRMGRGCRDGDGLAVDFESVGAMVTAGWEVGGGSRWACPRS
jgi:hypothetical protein